MLDYHLLDVFTTTPLTGNPLAVFIDQGVTDAALMQRIARELNLSETVFVSPPPDGAGPWPTRIFTPGTELPFAGHPTVGTAALLKSLGLVDGDTVVLAEGVGDVHVRVTPTSGELTTATLPKRVTEVDRAEAAAALGVSVGDLHTELYPAVWDCGVPFAIIPVRDVATLGRTRGVPVLEQSLHAVTPIDGVGAHWQARAFAPSFGIAEDPATGSAAAAFAGFLSSVEGVRDVDQFVIAQGIEMGRPSEIRLSVDRDQSGTISAVRVGGDAVVVGSGSLRL